MVLVWVLLSAIIGSIAHYYWKKRRLYKLANQFAGPYSLPLIGNGLTFLCSNEDVLHKLNNLLSNSETNNLQPSRFWLGPNLLICFQDPHFVEKILSSSKFSYKHDLYDFVKVYLGEGLVSASGPQYKIHRRFIQPLFNIKFCNGYFDIFQRNISLCMEELSSMATGQLFDIHLVLHKYFVNIVGETVLGTKIDYHNGMNTSFVDACVEIYNLGFTRLVKPWLYPDIIYNRTNLKKREDELLNIIREYLHCVIIESWERRKFNKTEDDNTPIIDQISNQIKEHPEFMKNEDFVSHLFTLYLASEDTVTIICSFTCLCLGMYPEYQAKAAAEIREVFGEIPRSATLNDIEKLNYLDMCIKDALRLFPIAPYILRKVLEETEIENYTLPKDSAVVIPIFNLHRNPTQWENPHHFHPDHFLPEAVKKRHVYSYVPFSAGPRNCIGKIFAKLALKLMLANLLQHFEIEADGKLPDLKLRMDISIRPVQGYNVRIKKRIWHQ